MGPGPQPGREASLDPLNGFAVLLVDDHPLFRDGLATALRHQAPGLRLAAVATLDDARQALSADTDGFDLILIDYWLPDLNGLRCAELLGQEHPGVGIGLMSGADDPTLPRRARESGLVAYLPKSLEISVLMEHLRSLAQGQPVFDIPGPLAAPAPTGGNPYGLTSRQTEILRLLATGASNKEIARACRISPATVKNHLEAIFQKTGATNRLQATMLAQAALEGVCISS